MMVPFVLGILCFAAIVFHRQWNDIIQANCHRELDFFDLSQHHCNTDDKALILQNKTLKQQESDFNNQQMIPCPLVNVLKAKTNQAKMIMIGLKKQLQDIVKATTSTVTFTSDSQNEKQIKLVATAATATFPNQKHHRHVCC
jgi:hypothetical protein